MSKTRRQQIQFHIKSDDYFGTLATVLDLIAQTIEQDSQKIISSKKRQAKIINRLKKDLVFLQDNYQIIKKAKI